MLRVFDKLRMIKVHGGLSNLCMGRICGCRPRDDLVGWEHPRLGNAAQGAAIRRAISAALTYRLSAHDPVPLAGYRQVDGIHYHIDEIRPLPPRNTHRQCLVLVPHHPVIQRTRWPSIQGVGPFHETLQCARRQVKCSPQDQLSLNGFAVQGLVEIPTLGRRTVESDLGILGTESERTRDAFQRRPFLLIA